MTPGISCLSYLKYPLAVASIILCLGCVSKPADTASPLSRADLFRLHCSSCHGDGTGNGHVAANLGVRPRNLKFREWQDSVSDVHILEVVRSGGAKFKLSDKMPSFAEKLTEAQMLTLVQYIRSFRY